MQSVIIHSVHHSCGDLYGVDKGRDTSRSDFTANTTHPMEEPGHPTPSALSETVTAWLNFLSEGRKDENPVEGGALGMAAALRSVSSSAAQSWAEECRLHLPVHKLMSALGLGQEDAGVVSPAVDQAGSPDGSADPVEEVNLVPFKSKYLHVFPLYQDYCQRVVPDCSESSCERRVVSEGLVSEPGTFQHRLPLQGLRFKAKLQVTDLSQSTPTPRFHRDTRITFWQDLDEVKEYGFLHTLGPREVNRQEAMFEVISSEASYLRSLGVVVNHFLASKKLRGTVSRLEHHVLFSNLNHVMSASEEFLMALECLLGECVVMPQLADLVLQHCPRFRALYVPYLSNMMFQEALVNKLAQENKRFAAALKSLESDPTCQRQSLKSFLVLPFQRITRLKLLMENILKLTEPDADLYFNQKKAIEALHKVIMQCNEGVQGMKRMEELVCLEMLLDFSNVKLFPLIVKGRYLMQEGPLRELTKVGSDLRTSFNDVYLHLFNDLLVISLQKEHRFSVLDHASFPGHVRVEPLNASLLGLPADSFLLHLFQNHAGQATALVLAAPSRSDKEAWMKVLSDQN